MPFTLLIAISVAAAWAGHPDIVAAHSECDDYAGWVVSGTAFGTRPVHGTLPGQAEVTGFSVGDSSTRFSGATVRPVH